MSQPNIVQVIQKQTPLTRHSTQSSQAMADSVISALVISSARTADDITAMNMMGNGIFIDMPDSVIESAQRFSVSPPSFATARTVDCDLILHVIPQHILHVQSKSSAKHSSTRFRIAILIGKCQFFFTTGCWVDTPMDLLPIFSQQLHETPLLV